LLALPVAVCLIAGALVFSITAGQAQDEQTQAKHAYVGATYCKMCHNKPEKGEQYNIWKKQLHSKAYETLLTDEAKAIAAEKGIENPAESPDCTRCHVAGYDAPADMLTKKYDKKEGVTCESCHGPGGDYTPMSIMEDEAKAKEAGLIEPNEKVCKRCHNPESPTFKEFNFSEAVKKIAHPTLEAGG
jgi:cytochrome c553